MKLTELKQKVYYHGTARKDPEFKGLGKFWRGGIYFTPSHKEAVTHAKSDAEIDGGEPIVIHAHLTFKNPKQLSGVESHEFTADEVRALMKDGYDAVVNGVETAVFDTPQIEVLKVEKL